MGVRGSAALRLVFLWKLVDPFEVTAVVRLSAPPEPTANVSGISPDGELHGGLATFAILWH